MGPFGRVWGVGMTLAPTGSGKERKGWERTVLAAKELEEKMLGEDFC